MFASCFILKNNHIYLSDSFGVELNASFRSTGMVLIEGTSIVLGGYIVVDGSCLGVAWVNSQGVGGEDGACASVGQEGGESDLAEKDIGISHC